MPGFSKVFSNGKPISTADQKNEQNIDKIELLIHLACKPKVHSRDDEISKVTGLKKRVYRKKKGPIVQI